MRKALLVGCVLLGFLVIRDTGSDAVVAQGKKAAGVIEIGEGKDGKFRFFVRDSEGKLLAMSGPGGFASVDDAKTAIESLRDVVAKAKVTMAKKKSKSKDKE